MTNAEANAVEILSTAVISLTPQEAKLRNLLLDVAHHIDESKDLKEKLELRFAGGWVRDKLLDVPSHDIDTAINAMTGLDFSMKMKEYLDVAENRAKHGIENVSNLHKIAANPEKSKHLETVTTKILGYDVDFVNLRKETYTDDSRHPQMEFGTAKEDALRRDATVNALFYNLHTDEVEDFTGGLAHIKAKLIKTPLDPYQTFVDDPLRVLRLIRFASRLGFTIDPESEKAMSDPAIQEALKMKISRERVGLEVGKMLTETSPCTALQYINRLGLYRTIFTDPAMTDLPVVDLTNWNRAYDCLHIMMQNNSPMSVYKLLIRNEGAEELAWLMAALAPWAPFGSPPPKASGKRSLPFGAMAAREGIKATGRIVEVVAGAFRHLDEIMELKRAVLAKEPYTLQRDILGMQIRRWDYDGGNWKIHIMLAILVEALRCEAGYEEFLGAWQHVLDHLEDLNIMEAATAKRIIDGHQLSKKLHAKPGAWMTQALDIVMAWQFRNPTATDPQEAIDEVRAKAEELKIPMK